MTAQDSLKFRTELVCDFCLKDQTQVWKLIRGRANACICPECVEIASEILKEEREAEKK